MQHHLARGQLLGMSLSGHHPRADDNADAGVDAASQPYHQRLLQGGALLMTNPPCRRPQLPEPLHHHTPPDRPALQLGCTSASHHRGTNVGPMPHGAAAEAPHLKATPSKSVCRGETIDALANKISRDPATRVSRTPMIQILPARPELLPSFRVRTRSPALLDEAGAPSSRTTRCTTEST